MPVEKTRAGGRWTEARYRQFLRSGLRQLSRKWPPIHDAKMLARVPYEGPNKRRKWSSRCAECRGLFKESETQVDHIDPCGTLTDLSKDLVSFVERTFCERSGRLQVLCKECHQARSEKP